MGPGGGGDIARHSPAARPECGGMEQSLSTHCCPRFFPTGGRSTVSPPGKDFPSTWPVSQRQGPGRNMGKELSPGPQEASCLIGKPQALTSRSFNLWGGPSLMAKTHPCFPHSDGGYRSSVQKAPFKMSKTQILYSGISQSQRGGRHIAPPMMMRC